MRRTLVDLVLFGKEMPCGCVRGERVCRVAARLLEAALDAHERAVREGTAEAWDAFHRARLAYDEHFVG